MSATKQLQNRGVSRVTKAMKNTQGWAKIVFCVQQEKELNWQRGPVIVLIWKILFCLGDDFIFLIFQSSGK